MEQVIVRDSRYCRCEGPDNLCAFCEEQIELTALIDWDRENPTAIDSCLRVNCGHARIAHEDAGCPIGVATRGGVAECGCPKYTDDVRDER